MHAATAHSRSGQAGRCGTRFEDSVESVNIATFYGVSAVAKLSLHLPVYQETHRLLPSTTRKVGQLRGEGIKIRATDAKASVAGALYLALTHSTTKTDNRRSKYIGHQRYRGSPGAS